MKANKQYFQRLNSERAAVQSRILVSIDAIPVLSLGVHAESKRLVIVGFHHLRKDQITEMLTDYLNDVNGADFYSPDGPDPLK
jgi:hypothetical protein